MKQQEEIVLPKKPFCVGWPHDMMVLVWALVAVGCGLTLVLLPVSIGIAIALFRRQSREAICGRELSTIAFSLIALACLHGVCSDSGESTRYYFMEEWELWESGYWKDPCDGIVLGWFFLLCSTALVVLPWLPVGNRYYRALADAERSMQTREGVGRTESQKIAKNVDKPGKTDPCVRRSLACRILGWPFRVFFDSWYGAICTGCVCGFAMITMLVRYDGKCEWSWLMDRAFVLLLVLAAVHLIPTVVSLCRKHWMRALVQFAGIAVVGVIFWAAFVFTGMCHYLFVERYEDYAASEHPWRASKITQEIPFSVEFQDAHPFLAEYERRIGFRSGKRIPIEMDTGGGGLIDVYSLSEDEYYAVDQRGEGYRVNVTSEKVDRRCGRHNMWLSVAEDGTNSVECAKCAEKDCASARPGMVLGGEPVDASFEKGRLIGSIETSGRVWIK